MPHTPEPASCGAKISSSETSSTVAELAGRWTKGDASDLLVVLEPVLFAELL
jgi:hypothetical protein